MSVSTKTVKSSAASKILTEDVITIQDARKELGSLTGRRPDKATCYRWVNRGVGGTKLEAIRLGNQLFTSRQALTRFIEARSTN